MPTSNPFKVDYTDLLNGPNKKKRKAFKVSTKKIEWMKAGGHKTEQYTEQGKFVHTSKCRRCHRKLKWGDRSYEFDHKNNNPANNSQRNCYLVCKICHGKATVIGKRKIHDPYLGGVIGHETIKRKVGYKKSRGKSKKKRRRRKTKNPFEVMIPSIKIP
jgi:hypothetical protein